jgi:uncharacterized membrane protein (DUF485 family)
MQSAAATAPAGDAQIPYSILCRARRRRRFALRMTGALALLYIGFLFLVELRPALLAHEMAPGISLAILCGTIMIVLSWLLTFAYVAWMNAEDRNNREAG